VQTTASTPIPPRNPSTQRGASLLVVVMILIIVSILGIGGAQIALMSERGARNDTALQLAWQSAELGLMDAQADITTGTREGVFVTDNQLAFVAGCGAAGTSGSGLCLPSAGSKPAWLEVDLRSDDGAYTEFGAFTGRSFNAGDTGIQPAQAPRYVIEILDDPDVGGNLAIGKGKRYIYRVTAIGFGPRADIHAVTQMVYRKE
jgi:type IV pilus assembly protein PilX